MLQSGTVIKNKYEMLGVIGKGGMSTVYKARDCENGRILAIKDVARAGTQNDQVVAQSLAVEGRMLKQLDNEHLPHIYDIIEDENSFMLVMDYVAGESLDKLILRCGAQSEENVLNWGMQICQVFSYLHNQTPPVIYRDMKPANLILCPDGRIMMIDFGTARTQKLSQDLRSDTICIGTEGFAAPEQYGGYGESNAMTDIFCLGSTLYNLLTGHSPCDAPRGILPLSYWNAELENSPLNAIIKKCTQNDPHNRYQTAQELYDDLKKSQDALSRGTSQWSKLSFTGNLRKNLWQRQNYKVGGDTSQLNKLVETTEAEQDAAQSTASEPWKRELSAGLIENGETQEPPGAQEEEEPGGIWRKLMLFSAIAALVLLLIGAILLITHATLAGTAIVIFAAAAAVLAVFGAVGMLREQRESESNYPPQERK